MTPGFDTWISIGGTVVETTSDFDDMGVRKRRCFVDSEDPFKNDPLKLYDVSQRVFIRKTSS